MPVLSLKNINHLFKKNPFFRKKFQKEETLLSRFIFSLLDSYPINQSVYQEAFTHSSLQSRNLNGNIISYERLEFLGDAILGMVIADYLFSHLPHKNEGELTQLRSKIVNRKNLNAVGVRLELEKYLLKNKNLLVNSNVSGNLLEALIGAIFLDKGYEITQKFILEKVISSNIEIDKLEKEIVSYRGFLLEWSQKAKKEIEFKVYEEENANKFTIFVCEIFNQNQLVARGREISKKKAVEMASKRAYYVLKKQIDLEKRK